MERVPLMVTFQLTSEYRILDFFRFLVLAMVFYNSELKQQQNGEDYKTSLNKTLWSVHFGVVVVELINCKCGGIVRNEIW